MQWDSLIQASRLGHPRRVGGQDPDRSEFQRDYDRIVFSPAFRRLNGKTQVFPLPETDVIHTRLTHSLEAACVGRSLGAMVGHRLEAGGAAVTGADMAAIVSAACLAHDIGNPPFGHSGEEAIAEYFQNGGRDFLLGLDEGEAWDFTCFEGNAMGFHLLTYSNPNWERGVGSFSLTHSTLGAYTKYPRFAKVTSRDKRRASEKKPGVFRCDLDAYLEVSRVLEIPAKGYADRWFRHPAAFLTEAADDICYNVMDLEDGFKHGLVAYQQVEKFLAGIVKDGPEAADLARLGKITDNRNKVVYLRAKAINSLIHQVAETFISNAAKILDGEFDRSLCKEIASTKTLKEIEEFARAQIYSHRDVLQVEAAGFEVLPGLLDTFLSALKFPRKSSSTKVQSLIPKEYLFDFEKEPYCAIMSITTYVAGMTDHFAIDTYRNLRGIQLPNY